MITKEDVHTGAKTSEASTSKWVKNLLDKPLTQAQRSLLAHGPNYAVIPLGFHQKRSIVQQLNKHATSWRKGRQMN